MTAIPILKKIDIFISSPNDVELEREAIKRAIELLNRSVFIAEGYLLFPLAYEELVPPEIGQPAQIIIDQYMQEPEQCYMLICVLWTRMGTPFTHPITNQVYLSGTEYEFIKAYEANKKVGKPLVLLYRRELSDEGTNDPEQVEMVKAFFDRFNSEESNFVGLYKLYSSLDEFKNIVLEHIAKILREHPPDETLTTVKRPKMIEEERQLDTAIPKTTRVNQPTELWVQLCISGSVGFRNQLPKERTSEFDLSQEDINEQSLGVAFPIDSATGLPKSTVLFVDVVAPDFEIHTSRMAVEVEHGKDSARLLFSVVPKVVRAKSIVHVAIKQRMPEGIEVLVATTALYTRTVDEEVNNPVWSLIRNPIQTIGYLLPILNKASYMGDQQEYKMICANQQDYQDMMNAHIPIEIQKLMTKLTWWGSWEEEPEVAVALTKLGELAMPALLQSLRNERKVWGIIRALKEIGSLVFPFLTTAIADTDFIMRRNAALALGRIGGTLSVTPLIVALRDQNSSVRSAAASALEDLGRNAGSRPVAPLIAALSDEESTVRSAAALALGSIGDTQAVDVLISSLFDKDFEVRSSSSSALYRLGNAAIQAILAAGIEVIQALVEIEEAPKIIYASTGWMLRAIGEPAVGPLIEALHRNCDSKSFQYKRITGVLKSIGTPSALSALFKMGALPP